jgi:hypothetical protein
MKVFVFEAVHISWNVIRKIFSMIDISNCRPSRDCCEPMRFMHSCLRYDMCAPWTSWDATGVEHEWRHSWCCLRHAWRTTPTSFKFAIYFVSTLHWLPTKLPPLHMHVILRDLNVGHRNIKPIHGTQRVVYKTTVNEWVKVILVMTSLSAIVVDRPMHAK